MADDFTTAVANLPFMRQRHFTDYDFPRITQRGLITREPFQRHADGMSDVRTLREEDRRLSEQLEWYIDLQDKPRHIQHYDRLQTVIDRIHNALGENAQNLANLLSMTQGVPPSDTMDDIGMPPIGSGYNIRNRVLRKGTSSVRR
jgi:hypothetical protein